MTAALQTAHRPRRAYSRLGVGIPANLLCFGGLRWVTLVDLSQSGAKLEVSGPGKVGGGLLRWLGYEAFGDPAWQLGNELALHFDEPIDLAWLLDSRRHAPVEPDRGLPIHPAALEPLHHRERTDPEVASARWGRSLAAG